MPKRHFLRMPKFPTRPGPSPDLDRNRFSGPDNTGKLRKGQRQPGHGMFMVGLQHKKTLIRTRPQTIVFQRLHKGLQPPIMWNGRAWAHGIMGWRHTQWCCFYTVTLNHDHPASSSLCYGQLRPAFRPGRSHDSHAAVWSGAEPWPISGRFSQIEYAIPQITVIRWYKPCPNGWFIRVLDILLYFIITITIVFFFF